MTENVHGLLAAYAVDAVTAEERSDFEAHLPGCDDCALELAGFQEVAAEIAAAEDAAPPAGLRDRVLAEASRTAQLPPQGHATDRERGAADELRARRPRWRPLSVVAASLALVVAGIGVGTVLAGDDASTALEKEVMMVASAPDAHAMDLGLGTAHLVMSDKMEAVVAMGDDCPNPKDGMEYQLWLVMDDGTKVAGPTFMPEDDGSFMTMMDTPMEGVTGFAVTEEPHGGSEQPTSDMVAAVEL